MLTKACLEAVDSVRLTLLSNYSRNYALSWVIDNFLLGNQRRNFASFKFRISPYTKRAMKENTFSSWILLFSFLYHYYPLRLPSTVSTISRSKGYNFIIIHCSCFMRID